MAELAEGARLLSVYGAKPHRGFKSLPLRQTNQKPGSVPEPGFFYPPVLYEGIIFKEKNIRLRLAGTVLMVMGVAMIGLLDK